MIILPILATHFEKTTFLIGPKYMEDIIQVECSVRFTLLLTHDICRLDASAFKGIRGCVPDFIFNATNNK